MGVTTKSFVAIYIIGPFTYPFFVSDMGTTNSKVVHVPELMFAGVNLEVK